jgi:hypothetical protein
MALASKEYDPTGFRFFFGMPLDPPLAGIIATTLLLLIFVRLSFQLRYLWKKT